MEDNFKCPLTGETFHIASYRCVFKGDGTQVYKAHGRELVNDKHPEKPKLVFIKKEVDFKDIAVFGSTKDRMVRNNNHFKERAKKHDKSPDQQYLRQQRTNQELNKYMNKSE